VDLTIGSNSFKTTFFVVEANTSYNALLGWDKIHANMCVIIITSSFDVLLLDRLIETIKANDKPFMINLEMIHAWLYSDDNALVIDNIGHLFDFLVNEKTIYMGQLTIDFARPNNL
jgi:hypothetical protein